MVKYSWVVGASNKPNSVGMKVFENLVQNKFLGKIYSINPKHREPVNLDVLINTLLRVSEMICELPHIHEMHINPFIINEHEAMAVDARIVIAPAATSSSPYSHMVSKRLI